MYLPRWLSRRSSSIRSQVITFLISGIVLLSTVIGLLTAAGVNEQSRELMLKNSFQITEGLAKQAVYSILSGSQQNADDAIEQVLGFQSVISVRLLLDNGMTFISAGSLISTPDPSYTNETQVVIEREELWVIHSPIFLEQEADTVDEQFMLDTLAGDKQVIGYAEVTYSKGGLIEVQTRVAWTIFIVASTSVVLFSLILSWILDRLFKPLRALADTMEQAKDTGEHLFAQIEGAKELRKMAISYNSMMRVLDQQDEDLKIHRNSLEKEVEVRTKELVHARDAAMSANRHKSEFLANMTHELRTPIQSILGYTELVSEELEDDGQFHLVDDMTKVETNANRLLTLINGILDLAKIEAGKIDLKNETFQLDEMLNGINDTIVPIAAKNSNAFIIEQNSNVIKLTLDKDKLEHALLNLLSNACKFTEDGTVKLLVQFEYSTLTFEVSDTGIGLSKEQQCFIFDEFRQVDGSQSRQFSGTGLGLAISQRFIHLMGGDLSVESELGKGATFTVTLPLLVAPSKLS